MKPDKWMTDIENKVAAVKLGLIPERDPLLDPREEKFLPMQNPQYFQTWPNGEPMLDKGRRYKYTTSGAPTGCTRKKWWNMTVIHHEPELHLVWVKMEASGRHRVIGTQEFVFKALPLTEKE